jgi:hypothetical protein
MQCRANVARVALIREREKACLALCERFENGTTFNCREAVVPFISLYLFFFGMTLALSTMWARERYHTRGGCRSRC